MEKLKFKYLKIVLKYSTVLDKFGNSFLLKTTSAVLSFALCIVSKFTPQAANSEQKVKSYNTAEFN